MIKKKKKWKLTSQNFRGVDAMQLTKTFKACGNFIIAEDIVYCHLELLTPANHSLLIGFRGHLIGYRHPHIIKSVIFSKEL
jgi:hypothetical protein